MLLECAGAAAAPARPRAPSLRVGGRVQVHGLAGSAQHNGKRGRLMRYHEAKARFAVQLELGGGRIAVRPRNLKALAAEDA